MPKTRTEIAAVSTTAAACFFILIAFFTSYWLQTDGRLRHPKFTRLGLWKICFGDFEDTKHWYDVRFNGCWWIFQENYYIIHDILLPGFYIATQFFMTLCFLLLIIASVLIGMYWYSNRFYDKYITLMWAISINLYISGSCAILACLIFGLNGDSRDWMPNWEHNNLSWSYVLACLGSLLLILAGSFFLAEARKATYRRLAETREPSHGSEFNMDIRKGQTDI